MLFAICVVSCYTKVSVCTRAVLGQTKHSVLVQMCPALSTELVQTGNKEQSSSACQLLISTQKAALIRRRHLSSNLLGNLKS